MRFRRFVFLVSIFAVAPILEALAAPQILGVVATNGPVPLICAGGVCKAEFGSVCLQRDRPMPRPGTAYTLADESVSLVVRAADGSETRLPAKGRVQVTSIRNYAAVVMTIGEDQVRALGGDRVAVQVQKFAAAVPVPVAGDPHPLTPFEIEMMTGPMLRVAARTVARQPEHTVAARVTMRMINAIPEGGAPAADDLWRQASQAEPQATSHPGVRRAARIYGKCRRSLAGGYASSLRDCLEGHHYGLMLGLTAKVWNRLGAGS